MTSDECFEDIDYIEDEDYEDEDMARVGTQEERIPAPFATGSVVMPYGVYNKGEGNPPYLILGHIWWNAEQTYAYYLIKCDDKGVPLDNAEPEYIWCHGPEEDKVKLTPEQVMALQEAA